ncbi:unnamed protein product [Paramecium sonneborni]|uniref:Uncharacterized protein n=1 Tax=Paramecium sonneborni TaxID=65129 RepID=A0A8S1QYG3_9CILI|nr:unnamed protein product [Paramecium sonneborni]
MSITHEQLRKYSYNRWKNSSQPIQEITQKRKQSDPEIAQLHNEIPVQFEKSNTQIHLSLEQPIEDQMIASDLIQITNQFDPNQAISKTSNLNKSEKNKIFQPLLNNNPFHQSIKISNQKGNNFTIQEQFNIRIDPKLQTKINKSIQKNEDSIKQTNQQVLPNQHLFLQTNQISQYIEISQQVDEQNEFKEEAQKFQFQELLESNKQMQIQSEFLSSKPKNEDQEQQFPQIVQMDIDFNKDEYLKIIYDYIEFIKMTEYTDVQLIENEILKQQHITSQKQFMLRIEPLIINMLFEEIPNNPFQKQSDLQNQSIDYADFYDKLKSYRTQLEQDLYVPNLSQFMHFQLSQQTLNFLQLKRQQIKWTPSLFKSLQRSRNVLITIFQIYNQIKQSDILLFDADIDAFKIQLKQIDFNEINIFQNLFRKYQTKTLKRLNDLKQINQKIQKNKSIMILSQTEHQNMNQLFQTQLEEFRYQLKENQNESPIEFRQAMSLIKQFNNIQSLYIQIKQLEKNFEKDNKYYVPIEFQSEKEMMKIFDLMYINLKHEILKTKKLITLPIGKFSWEHQIQEEEEALKTIKNRFCLLKQFYEQSIQKYKTEYQFIRQLKKGQITISENINSLEQYLYFKQNIYNKSISMFSYPKIHFQQIAISTLIYRDLFVQTNNKIVAIQQLNKYQFIEELQLILSDQNYPDVKQRLMEMKNKLNYLKFSKLIQDEIELLLSYINKALCYFPYDLMNIFIKTKTYEEIELELGDIEQFEALENSNMQTQSQELFEIFKTFFESKIQHQFDEIFIQLYEMSKDQHSDWNPIKLGKRIDLLYEYKRQDLEDNPYIKKELIDQIIDYPDLRYLFQEGRLLFIQLRELIEEEKEFEKNNQKILTLIQDFEAPEGLDFALIDLKPLLNFHKNLKKIDKYMQLKNEIINLGLILQQEYSYYLLSCQNKIKKLFDCFELKINSLDKQILDNILFKPINQNVKIPIYELHTYFNFCYTDFQSIKIQRFANNKQRNIILFTNKPNENYDEDIDIVLQVHNIGIYVDQQLSFQCE